MTHDTSPLDFIIDAIADGKPARLARLLNVHRSTVSGWRNEARRAQGMCGTVPERYLPRVLEIAGLMGVEIPVSKLIASS